MKILRVEGVQSGGHPQRRLRSISGRMSITIKSSKPAAVPRNHLEPRPPRRRSRRRSAYGHPAAFRPPYIRLVELPEKRTVLSNRRLYRAAHQETITNQIHIVNYNTQGWDPVRRDNVLKTTGIIDSARLGKWNLAFLTELHGHDTDQRPAPEIMRIEEYTIIRFGMVAFLMDQATAKMWIHGGSILHFGESNRVLGLTFRSKGHQYNCVCTYVPTSSSPQE